MGPLDLVALEQRSTVVLDRDGRLLRPFTTAAGRWRLPVTAAEVDPRYLAMLEAFEDGRFRAHPGVDPLALLRAAGQWLSHGHVVSGASTLTMQVARLLEPREDRTLGAKLRQMVRAVELERRLSKTEILSAYLTLAPYGGNIEGVRAASFVYFGKEPRRLSVAEAALLVALPQSPETRRPDRGPRLARAARDRVLARAVRAGVLGEAEAAAARLEPVPRARRPLPMLAPHLSEQALAADPTSRVIRLTLDGRLQASLEALLSERVAAAGPLLSGAIVVIDNATGEVRAHVGSPDYFAAERAGAVDAARALRSPGSALKPFIYALAFENGIAHPETMMDDRPSRYGGYVPENFDMAFQGTVTARKALQQSLNLPAVELLSELGPPRLLARLRGSGAAVAVPKDSAPGLAIGLGGVGIRLVDLARLYVAFTRGGSVPPLRWRADRVAEPGTERRLCDPVSAWYVADILRGAPPPLNAAPGRIAYKTGTSYGYRDAWAAGFDRRHTIAVWVGRPDNGAVPGLVGRLVAAPVLFDAFSRIGSDPEPIPAPKGALIATNANLPPPLRSLRKDESKSAGASLVGPLRIAFPPDGARVDLGASRPGRDVAALALKATGGLPPLIWLVNGVPVGGPQPRRRSEWMPDGAGFARVSVMDARGLTDSVSVRID
nr:penicillin-binding protein 1C [Chelatococcus reniformis]